MMTCAICSHYCMDLMTARGYRTIETAGVAALCAALIAVIHTKHIYDADDGVTLDGAWNLLNGIVPYTDSFEFIPPGSFYLIYAVWELLGPSYWSARLTGGIFVLAGAIGIHLITIHLAEQIGRPARVWLRAWPPVCFCLMSAFFPIISHNVFSIVIVIWTTYLACLGLRRPTVAIWMSAGVLLGLSALFLHPRAFAVAIALSGSLAIQSWKAPEAKWLGYIAVLAICSSLVVSVVLLYWDFGLLWKHMIQFPLERYRTVNRPPAEFLVAAFALLFAVAWLLRRNFRPSLVLLTLVQFMLVASASRNAEPLHLLFIMFPTLCLLAAALELPGKSLSAGFFPIAVATLPIAAALTNMQGAWRDRSIPAALGSAIRTHCNETRFLYAGPYLPGLHFEVRKINPTPFSLLLHSFNTPQHFRDAIQGIEIRKPACVLVDFEFPVQWKSFIQNSPLHHHIAANYRTVEQFGTLQIMTRIEP